METPQGPSDETLKRLAEQLPSFIAGMETKKTVGKGRKISIPAPPKPRQICRVCSKAFDYAHVEGDSEMKPGLCDTCEPMLKQGCVALISSDKYAFVKSPRLADMAGQIIPISHQNMEKVLKEYNAEWSERVTPKTDAPPGNN